MASVTYGKFYLMQMYYGKYNYGKNIYGKNTMANETEPSAHVKVGRVNIEIKLIKDQRYHVQKL